MTSSVTTAIEHLTPADACRILESNTRNRNINQRLVKQLLAKMQAGIFMMNGDTIRISATKRLIDGQHRLTAWSMMPDDTPAMAFIVVRGLPDESQRTIDLGKRRSVADQLKIEGHDKYNTMVGAAARLYILWQTRSLDLIRQAKESDEIVRWLIDENPDIYKGLVEIGSWGIKSIPGGRESVAATAIYQFSTIDYDDARTFADMLVTGANLGPGHPALVLRDRLMKDKSDKRNNQVDQLAMYIQAWNAFRTGRTMQRLQKPRTNDGVWCDDNFPQPR